MNSAARAAELANRVGASGVYIDGEFANATSGRLADVISPRNEQVIAQVPLAGAQDVERAVAAARRALEGGEWPLWPPTERAAALRRLADGLAARTAELVELGVEESGFPIAFSERAMAAVPAATLRRYADICGSRSVSWPPSRPSTGRSPLEHRRPPPRSRPVARSCSRRRCRTR
jgi:acyl-CoA reductase-like NAD-dependent aldehyde dehydrogenase